MNISECLQVRCHSADLVELIYIANKNDYTITRGRSFENSLYSPRISSPREDKCSPRTKQVNPPDEDYMLVSIAIPILCTDIRKSKLTEFELSLKSQGKMIWKIEDTVKNRLKVYTCAAIISRVSNGSFQFERPKNHNFYQHQTCET